LYRILNYGNNNDIKTQFIEANIKFVIPKQSLVRMKSNQKVIKKYDGLRYAKLTE